jgi:anti-sigma-K factor RskA
VTLSGGPRSLDPVDGDRYTTWDAAYVLGSLSSAERREYEAHLETCERCRAAVGEISGMPALLAMLDVEDVQALATGKQPDLPPLRPELRTQVLDKVRWRRRRSRLLTYAAVGVAAAVLAAGLVIAVRPGIVGLQTGSSQVAAQQLEMKKLVTTPFSATISLSSFAWGTRIDMACVYGDWTSGGQTPPSNLGMVVVGRDGSRSQIATWLGMSGATALPSGNTPVPVEQIASVQLVSADSGEVLLERQL